MFSPCSVRYSILWFWSAVEGVWWQMFALEVIVSADDLVLLANFEDDLRRVEEWIGAGGWVGLWRRRGRGVWSWSPDGARLIPEGALEGFVVGVLMPARYGVLMREVGARALWLAGDRGCGGFWVEDVCRGSQGFGQIGDRVCWTG